MRPSERKEIAERLDRIAEALEGILYLMAIKEEKKQEPRRTPQRVTIKSILAKQKAKKGLL